MGLITKLSSLSIFEWVSYIISIILLQVSMSFWNSLQSSSLDQLLIQSLYRVTLHPYAKYPGPFLAKISDLYATYFGWYESTHLEAWRRHEKYGKRNSNLLQY